MHTVGARGLIVQGFRYSRGNEKRSEVYQAIPENIESLLIENLKYMQSCKMSRIRQIYPCKNIQVGVKVYFLKLSIFPSFPSAVNSQQTSLVTLLRQFCALYSKTGFLGSSFFRLCARFGGHPSKYANYSLTSIVKLICDTGSYFHYIKLKSHLHKWMKLNIVF